MGKRELTFPLFKTPLVETHCHLNYLKNASLEEILDKSKENGIEKIITIAVAPDNFDTVYQLAQNHPMIFCTQGVHPHQASAWVDEAQEKILHRASNSKVVAIGEIGLDYHYHLSPSEQQKNVFEKQCSLAAQCDLPVVIHSRDADDDMMSILKNMSSSMKKKGVIHSFTSSLQLAELALDLGFYLGFNGIITFKNAQNVRDVLEITPLERIVLETDSPFLTPVPFRGIENAPYFINWVAQEAAKIKKQETEDFLRQCYENSHQLFDFSGK